MNLKTETTSDVPSPNNDKIALQKTKKLPTSIADVQHVCQKRKEIYEACYKHWWKNAFTAGKLEVSRDDCDELFERYQACFLKGMKLVTKNQEQHKGSH